MVPFAGYEMPVQYTGVLTEARAVRSSAGLFDVSHMGQFRIIGNHALEETQKLVTNDLSRLSLGQAQYNMLCNPEGGVIDDLVVYRRKENEIYICVNASNRKVDFEWMKSHLKNSQLIDESDETALLALQGPNALSILSKSTDAPLQNLKYYWAIEGRVFDHPCYISRTGYTGEDGFELYVEASVAPKIWNRLLEMGAAQGLVPVGLGARDTLRLEMGYPLHGHELSQNISPLSAGLGWVVKLEKSTPFIGQEALRQEAKNGSSQLLKAFIIEDRRIARAGYEIFGPNGTDTFNTIGSITSGTHSPHLQASIAMGFVQKPFATLERVYVDVRGEKVPAKFVKLPFVQPKTRKN